MKAEIHLKYFVINCQVPPPHLLKFYLIVLHNRTYEYVLLKALCKYIEWNWILTFIYYLICKCFPPIFLAESWFERAEENL